MHKKNFFIKTLACSLFGFFLCQGDGQTQQSSCICQCTAFLGPSASATLGSKHITKKPVRDKQACIEECNSLFEGSNVRGVDWDFNCGGVNN